MDDDKDKGIIEKTIEAVEGFASEVKDTAKHVMSLFIHFTPPSVKPIYPASITESRRSDLSIPTGQFVRFCTSHAMLVGLGGCAVLG